MSDDAPVPWHELSESARVTVCHLVRSLAGGYTGRIVLDCGQGGVRNVTEERTLQANDDGSRSIEVRTFQPRELKKAS